MPKGIWAKILRGKQRKDELPLSSLGGIEVDKSPLVSQVEIDENELRELPSFLPRSVPVFSRLGMGDGIAKIGLISLVVTFIVLVLMTSMGGVSFVTKKDFTVNMANVATTIEQVKVDSAKTQSVVTSAVQGIPGTVATYVDNSVAQSISQWNSQLSSLSDKVTASNNNIQNYATTLSQLVNKVDNSDLEIATLKGDLSTLETNEAGYETRIKALENKVFGLLSDVATLQSQYSSTLVTVVGTVYQYSITNGVGIATPLVVSNSSNVTVTVPVKLVLTTGTSNITVTSASMNGGYTVSISGSMVTFYTTVGVGANSSVPFSGIQVVLNYTGTSPNTWSAVWSKQ